MSTNQQAPHETFRGQLIMACVDAGVDVGMTKGNEADVPAVIAGYMAMRLNRYIQMLEQLVDGEDLTRVQALIAERYCVRREEA